MRGYQHVRNLNLVNEQGLTRGAQGAAVLVPDSRVLLHLEPPAAAEQGREEAAALRASGRTLCTGGPRYTQSCVSQIRVMSLLMHNIYSVSREGGCDRAFLLAPFLLSVFFFVMMT